MYQRLFKGCDTCYRFHFRIGIIQVAGQISRRHRPLLNATFAFDNPVYAMNPLCFAMELVKAFFELDIARDNKTGSNSKREPYDIDKRVSLMPV